MDVLTLNGKQYVKASKAAKNLGYASDYVGQLCRSGAVDAHLVGRTWYVNPDTLGAHRIEKKRNARTKAREHAKKSIEEARRINIHESTKGYKNIVIHYEKDKKSLMPEVKKLPILSAVTRLKKAPEVDNEPSYTLENMDKKIIMSGVIPIRDAELEETYTDTVILEAKIQKSAKKPVHARVTVDNESDGEDTVDDDAEMPPNKAPLSFIDRLNSVKVATPGNRVDSNQTAVDHNQLGVEKTDGADEATQEYTEGEEESKLGPPYLLIQILCGATVILAFLSVFFEISYYYTEKSYDTSYSINSGILHKI